MFKKEARTETLSEQQIRKTKKYSIWDGSAWSVMYGFGEQYVTPFAIRLGATNAEVGILQSVPTFIGSVFQILGAKLTDNFQNRRKIVLFFALFQAIILLPLFIIPFLTKSILALTIFFTIYMLLANIMGPAWSSWIGDVIPEKERASYFSKRNKYVVASTLFSVIIAGAVLNYFSETNVWVGFAILFGVAFIGRMFSWYYTIKQFEPKFSYNPESYFSFKDFLKRMPDTNFGNFVMFRSIMAFAVMIASPFFAVFMLKDLQFSYIQYTMVVLVPMVVKIFTMTYWGKYSGRFGTRNILFVSGILIATIPLCWFLIGYFFSGISVFYLIMLAEVITGFSWAGFELATFNYILETVSPEKRPRGFAYFNMIFGTAVLLGGLFGAFLVYFLPNIISFNTLLVVFIISAVARLTCALALSNRLKEVKVEKKFDDTRLFYELVFAKPLSAAIHHATMSISHTEKDVKTFVKSVDEVYIHKKNPDENSNNAKINKKKTVVKK
ncbi:MAG: MFS transporter [Candidatus Woesearchaeota archaeon]